MNLLKDYSFAVLLVSISIFLSGTFCLTGTAFSDDANATRTGATFTRSTLILDLPELAVEGTDLLYSVKLKLKWEGENSFLELTNLEESQYQEASVVAAAMSADGTIHIPVMNFEDKSFWTIDLKLMDTTSLLPIKFNITELEQVDISSQNEDLLGQSKRKCIMFSLCTRCKPHTWCCDADYTHCVLY